MHLIFDFDNDGNKDIFISNGIYRDITDMDFSEFLANKSEVKKIVSKKGRFDFRDFLPYISSTKLPNYAYVSQQDLPLKTNQHHSAWENLLSATELLMPTLIMMVILTSWLIISMIPVPYTGMKQTG